MSLRLDDVNQKENQMLLSMQSLDHRVASLEDLARQNTEVHTHRGETSLYIKLNLKPFELH